MPPSAEEALLVALDVALRKVWFFPQDPMLLGPCQFLARPSAEPILFLLGPRPIGSASLASFLVPRVPTVPNSLYLIYTIIQFNTFFFSLLRKFKELSNARDRDKTNLNK